VPTWDDVSDDRACRGLRVLLADGGGGADGARGRELPARVRCVADSDRGTRHAAHLGALSVFSGESMNRFLSLIGLVALLSACGGETTVEAVDPCAPLEEGDVPNTLLPTLNCSTSCDAIVPTTSVGLACESNLACGQGGRCARLNAGGPATCAQVCFPEQGCETCGGEEQCVELLDSAGVPVRFDLDNDGTAETIGGTCQSPDAVTGPQGSYDACGVAEGACDDDLECLRSDARTVGTCYPTCTGACDRVGDRLPVCSGSTAGPDICIIDCTGAPETCPEGLECVAVAMGNSACMR
jgi:hypothetical protein